MKREISFTIVWELCISILLFVFYKILTNLDMLRNSTFEPKYTLLAFGAVILMYIMLGIFLGVLVANIKHFSKIGYGLISVYALYFALRMPLIYSGLIKGHSSIYPRWLGYQQHDYTTVLGCILLGLLIVNGIRYKTKWVSKMNEAVGKNRKINWIIGLCALIAIGIGSIVYETPQVSIAEECITLLYAVPELDDREVPTDDFQEICTEQGYNHIVGNHVDQIFRELAQEGQFTMDIKSIELSKINERKSEAMATAIVYEYEVKLLIDYKDSGDEKIVIEEGHINLARINGEWKVDFIKFEDLNALFTEQG